jgi:putative colanic acid biosynthesis UDP-glucose lipid carrier transferase
MTQPYLIYRTIRALIDIPILLFCFWIASNYVNGPISLSDQANYTFLIFSVIAWYSCAQVSNLYTDLRSNKFSEEITYIIFTLLLFTILLSSFLFFLSRVALFTNYFLIVYFACIFFLVTFFKYIIRKTFHRILQKGELLNRILLIGSTAAAKDFYETINHHYYYGYKCIGFLDNEKNNMNGCKYLGSIDSLSDVLSQEQVDEVILALPNSEHETIKASIATCDFHGKRMRIIPDLHLYASSNIQINTIGLLPVINLRSLPLDKWENKVVKRIFDILFSISFFILLGWWFMPFIAILIKISSKGPIYFKQERWGLNNNKIICYKFRTMYNGSPEMDQNGAFLQATKNDSRITPLGRILRKYNIDEFPQFWNVLKGNMSIVGPRPHVTPLNLASAEYIDKYLLRHLVQPGITGWAQVNGCRGETSKPGAMQRRVNYDLYYIHKWTFWLDCQIIIQTIINLIKGDDNAY